MGVIVIKSKCQEVENVVTKEVGNNFPTRKPWRPPRPKRRRKKNGEGNVGKKYQTRQRTKMTRKRTIAQMKTPAVSHSKRNHLSQSRNQNQTKNADLRVPRD